MANELPYEFLEGTSIKLGPKFEYMRMPTGQWGERITEPDGRAECWLDGEPCDPKKFAALLDAPDTRASIWKVS